VHVLTRSPPDREDGILQIREIANSMFTQAGSRNMVSAPWESDDALTPPLMQRFHAHLTQQLTSAEAPRAAQIDLRRRYGRTQSVAAWAPFVMVGE
jgi:CHAT domain-containing protein